MTLKTKCGIAIPAIAVVVMLLPTPLVDAVYHGCLEAFPVAQWVLPIIVAVISFLLLSSWVKALIAGAVSFGMSMFMFGLIGWGSLDCGSETIPLSRACDSDALVLVKIGFAGLICLNLFLLYRIAFPKTPKTPRAVQAK